MMKKLMSKKANILGKKVPLFVIALIAVIGVVSAAAYVVNSLTLTVGVAEPFTVEYAVLGDHGNYVSQTCEGAQWFTSDSTNLPTGNMYAGESRFVCVKVTNKAEVAIPYTITSTYMNDNTNYDCQNAFGSPVSKVSSVPASGVITDGASVTVDDGAKPVEGCQIKISVARG
jgi:hypothetical protein